MCPISVGGMYSVGPWIIHLSPGVRWTLSPAERRRENRSSQHPPYHTTSIRVTCCATLPSRVVTLFYSTKHFLYDNTFTPTCSSHTHRSLKSHTQLRHMHFCAIPSSNTYTCKQISHKISQFQSAACISSLAHFVLLASFPDVPLIVSTSAKCFDD